MNEHTMTLDEVVTLLIEAGAIHNAPSRTPVRVVTPDGTYEIGSILGDENGVELHVLEAET